MKQGIALLAVTGCLVSAPGCTTLNTTLRYRLTVVVDTPEGVRTGSSVVEVRGYLSPSFPGPEAGGGRLDLRGEATPVELPDGTYLFAVFAWVSSPDRTFSMLTRPFAAQLPQRSSNPSEVHTSMMKQFRALVDTSGVREVEPEDYPVIATFTDKADAHSIQISPAVELAKTKPGYRIVRMTVEITNAPVSHNILNILPALRRCDWGFFNPEIEKNWAEPFAEYEKIGHSQFIRGDVEYIHDHKAVAAGSPVPCIVQEEAKSWW